MELCCGVESQDVGGSEEEEEEKPAKGPSTSSSMSENDVLILSPSTGEASQDTLPSSSARTTPSAEERVSGQEWFCEYPNCGRSFSHRYKRTKHEQYHKKPYHCPDPSCLLRQVAFSREQDLVRHQSQHNGRRFHCPHANCVYAIGGAKDGFTRRDNLKRHLANKHRQSQQ
ncbi:hypothetical protein ACMFMG_000483 [Clarireedia jacksonii]